MPQYFIVKHDLDSFQKKPGLIWNTSKPKTKIPVGFRRVRREIDGSNSHISTDPLHHQHEDAGGDDFFAPSSAGPSGNSPGG
jgi:hypothetical protein